MSNEVRETWVNMCFRDCQLAEFLAIKEYLGIQTNVDVIRHLIRKEARAIRHAQALDSAIPGNGADPSPPPPLPQSAADDLCLSCSLPDCDETDPRCPYHQATGELDRKRTQVRAAVQRGRATRRQRAAQRARAEPDTDA